MHTNSGLGIAGHVGQSLTSEDANLPMCFCDFTHVTTPLVTNSLIQQVWSHDTHSTQNFNNLETSVVSWKQRVTC